jgi:hypothetical protein
MSMYSDPSDTGLLVPSDNDLKMEVEQLAEAVAGGPLDGIPEFRQHECWRMLHVYPDEVDETLPGAIVCAGCEARYRAELEWRP